MKVLIIADRQTSDTVRRLLFQEGHVVEETSDGEEGEYLALSNDYDLIVVAVAPPKINGIAICKSLRARGIVTPVLVLVEKGREDDGIRALNEGADEYVCKPVIYGDLIARARAILRRPGPSRVPRLQIGDLALDPVTKQARRGSRQIQLTKKEFTLLEYLMRNPGKVMTRTILEEHVWGTESENVSNVIDAYIRRLRRKIDDKDGSVIQTVRGFGYKMRPE
jgi:DNA-binding response OmpR family regulator